MPPSFGKRVGKMDNQPLHTTFVDGVAAIPFAIKAMLPLPHRA